MAERIRDHVELTGTKYGCGMSLCGACTVHVDGQPIRACSTPVSAVAGREVTTIEAIGDSPAGRALQQSWVKLEVPQCGYCQSGQIMSAAALLAAASAVESAAAALLVTNQTPTDADIDRAMSGNICRCATYVRIRAAIKDAAQSLA